MNAVKFLLSKNFQFKVELDGTLVFKIGREARKASNLLNEKGIAATTYDNFLYIE